MTSQIGSSIAGWYGSRKICFMHEKLIWCMKQLINELKWAKEILGTGTFSNEGLRDSQAWSLEPTYLEWSADSRTWWRVRRTCWRWRPRTAEASRRGRAEGGRRAQEEVLRPECGAAAAAAKRWKPGLATSPGRKVGGPWRGLWTRAAPSRWGPFSVSPGSSPSARSASSGSSRSRSWRTWNLS